MAGASREEWSPSASMRGDRARPSLAQREQLRKRDAQFHARLARSLISGAASDRAVRRVIDVTFSFPHVPGARRNGARRARHRHATTTRIAVQRLCEPGIAVVATSAAQRHVAHVARALESSRTDGVDVSLSGDDIFWKPCAFHRRSSRTAPVRSCLALALLWVQSWAPCSHGHRALAGNCWLLVR
jgi:hypothetical protein